MKTWEDRFGFAPANRRNLAVNAQLCGNRLTIQWYPRFLVREKNEYGFMRKLPPESPKAQTYIEAAIKGVLRWPSSEPPNTHPVKIGGIDGEVTVEVYDIDLKPYTPGSGVAYRFHARRRAGVNVRIDIGVRHKATVLDAFRWRKNRRMLVRIGIGDGHSSELSRVMEHEFGHVLGLFDAYGYAKRQDPPDGRHHYGGHPWPVRALPPAFIDGSRVKPNSVMVCNYAAPDGDGLRRFTRTALDYEMILTAWRDDRLQLYTDSILGKRSRAFKDDTYQPKREQARD